MADPLIIDPKEGIGEIFKLENKEELFNMHPEYDIISRAWQKGQRRGFIIQKTHPQRTYAIEVKGPQNMT